MASVTGTDPNEFATELFDGLPRHYDALGWLLSMGQDRRWRHEMVRHAQAPTGGLILDVATGTAGVALELRASTGAQVVGADLTAAMLDVAAAKLSRRDEHGVHLVQARGESLPFADGTFDSVTFTYLLRYVDDPAATIDELSRVLAPGGVLANLEFYVPPSPWWRAMWWCYTRMVLPVAGLVTGGPEWYRVGRFLGPSITNHYRHYPLEQTVEDWRAAGLTDVHVRIMSLGGGVVMWATKARADGTDASAHVEDRGDD
jgi:demethylmenaquinone methyltransferase/2-methoxy-6-polyprenyl-1,4-benzoquinol methylase